MFIIERDVPLPNERKKNVVLTEPKKKTRPEKYPFSTMAVGDSFEFPDDMRKNVSAACAQRQRNHGGRFTIRNSQYGYCRIWRVE